MYNALFTNMHMQTEAATTQPMATTTKAMAKATQSNVTTIASACVKCGISRKSGKLSCCAPGGSWFKQCGNPGDSNYDHTWDEGTQACEGKCTISAFAPDMMHSFLPMCTWKHKQQRLKSWRRRLNPWRRRLNPS